MLLAGTPVGLAGGLYEGYRLAGGLVFVMLAFIVLIGVAIMTVVRTIQREELAAGRERDDPPR